MVAWAPICDIIGLCVLLFAPMSTSEQRRGINSDLDNKHTSPTKGIVMEHVIVYGRHGHFAGWPANNGVWSWDDEILVGFTQGGYRQQSGHNIEPPFYSLLARSRDGGETWQAWDPPNYVGDGGELTDLIEPIDFGRPGLALRVVGAGYHGTEEKRGGFFFSYDLGDTWQGPYRFAGLVGHPELEGLELTPRTSYLVEGGERCLFFLSARRPDSGMADRAFCARTGDGGLSFQFLTWMVPWSDPHRAVMPSVVQCSAQTLVAALRRRQVADVCWIDAYVSRDAGQSWSFLSRVGETGDRNGNPPALVRLSDGRLCCVYGQRSRWQLIARLSDDQGESWLEERVLRDDYASVEADADLGYPRLVQRADGRLVAIYYWATRDRPHQHIAATIWQP